jgi:glycosyltransferase involved in cell wall biosynthesis
MAGFCGAGMPEVTLFIFDPNITAVSPAGSCLLKMLRAAAEQYHLEIFTAQTDLQAQHGITIHKMPVPMRPVFLQSICFSLLAIVFDLCTPGNRKRLKIATQGGFPFCDICYAHNCHKLFLTRYRSNIVGDFFTRTARLLNYQWIAATEGLAFRHARLIVAPSRGLANELSETYGAAVAAKVRLISNPVDCRAFAPRVARVPEGRFTFAFCALGSFEWKGLRLILEALATGMSAQLLVIGGSVAEIERFRKVAESARVASQVSFTGLQKDIRHSLWHSDAFVFPSVHETFPLVCLQAAAAGLPLIATDLYGLEELLQPGVSGWRVERNVDSLCVAMREALADRGRTHELGRNAQVLAQKYDEPEFQQRWLQLLKAAEA